MFFLIGLIFLVELIVLYILVTFLLHKDAEILILTNKIEQSNTHLKDQLVQVEGIFSDIKTIVRNKNKKFEQKQKKLLISRCVDTLEWFFMFLLKKQGKKFLLGYKIAKYLSKELSLVKHVL